MSHFNVVTVTGDRLITTDSYYVVISETATTSSTLQWGVELELNGAGGGWTDVSADVRHVPIMCEYGIDGYEPTDRVASAGSLAFVLDNSILNSAATLGYYSPFHLSKRAGFDYNIGVRFWIWYGTVQQYKHVGKLTDILPVPGLYDKRMVMCKSLDYMDDLARIDVPDLAAQTGQRGDQLLTTILAAMTPQPAARSFDTWIDSFAYALDGGTGQRLKVREEINKLATSEHCYVYIKGDTSTGGVLRAEKRGARAPSSIATSLTFSDDMARDGLVVTGGRDDLYSTVKVIVHPTRVDAAATTVLFSLQTTTTTVAAGATLTTIFGPYRDPTSNDACGGVSMVAPAATTDYTMNTAADGLGSDLTASFSVSASYTGEGVRYSITNSSGSTGYITKLQARGKGVYRSEAVIEKVVTGAYGTRALTIDMPYQTSINVATNVSTYLASLLGTPAARVRSVRFLASKSATFLAAAIAREPGDRIEITETVTGLASDQFFIQKVKLELQRGPILWCTWDLVPAGLDATWTGDGGASAIVATGGTITDSGGYRYHTFTSNGTFEITANADAIPVDYLLVGAGGSGGGLRGGGGGGGGVVQGTAAGTVTTYAIVRGSGSSGNNGGDSTGFGATATGGGKGGASAAGSAGGSGGGGGGNGNAGGAGTSGQGYAGGAGALEDGGGGDPAGGGGGGAGAAGAAADYFLGNGGIGRLVWGTYYGGGGGNQDTGSGNGGTGGGGNGGAGGNPSTAGTDYLGGGGGGGETKRGGHGVVVVRYPLAV